MRKIFFQLVCCTLIFPAACMSALGAPSGLNVIPTADVLEAGVLSVETESDGSGKPWGGDCDSFALLQFGIGNGIELGVDKCTNDSDNWLNFKWQIRGESVSLPAFAVGTQSISHGDHPQPFAVATKSMGKTRLHTGIIDLDRKTRWMIGMDHPLGSRFTFQADYINGEENTSSYGIAVCLTESLSLGLAKTIGNSADVGNGYAVNFAWSMPWK